MRDFATRKSGGTKSGARYDARIGGIKTTIGELEKQYADKLKELAEAERSGEEDASWLDRLKEGVDEIHEWFQEKVDERRENESARDQERVEHESGGI